MPLIGTLQDDFDDNSFNGELWPGSYGTYSETGGRARVQCDPDYGAIVSAATYTFAGSSVFAQLFPPALGGATSSAYVTMSLIHSVEGTEIGTKIDLVTGKIRFQSNIDYWDDNAVELTYDSVAHSYVRISESGGTTTWSTSPDGSTWTTRRTAATPSWAVSSSTIQLQVETRRNSGTVDFAEIDNVNVVPTEEPPPAGEGSGFSKAAFLSFF